MAANASHFDIRPVQVAGKAPDMPSQGGIDVGAILDVDPLNTVEKLFMTLLCVGLLVVLYKNFDKVLILLTGDDRIHGTFLDGIWYTVFRCCGWCSDDWTKCLCPCFGGRGVMQVLGTHAGVKSTTIEISNIIVGDLPTDSERADFYVTVEYGSSPPMRTSLIQDTYGKCIHFPEVLTIKVKDSQFEKPVKFAVRKLTVVGSELICELSLNAQSVVHWASLQADDPQSDSDPEDNDWSWLTGGTSSVTAPLTSSGGKPKRRQKFKRFAMQTADVLEVHTPPWISIELTGPERDLRMLDTYGHASGLTSTYVRKTTTARTSDRQYEEIDMDMFKRDHPLKNGSGNPVPLEPPESAIASLTWQRYLYSGTYNCCVWLVVLAVVVYVIFRCYVGSCAWRYYAITIATKYNEQEPNPKRQERFPLSTYVLQQLLTRCDQLLEGTGVRNGQHYCRPNRTQVFDVCDHLSSDPTKTPYQPKPKGFQNFVENLPGLPDDWKGIPCFDGVCQVNYSLGQWDITLAAACIIALFFVLCALPPLCNSLINKRKQDLVKNQADSSQVSSFF